MTMLKTLAPYEFKSRDAVENYQGRQLLFVNWERHRMFSRPFVLALKPDTPFAAVLEEMAACFSYHPDWSQIDWDKAIWQNGNIAFTPERSKSLKENGIGHKDLIRFRTPGLDGIAGTGY